MTEPKTNGKHTSPRRPMRKTLALIAAGILIALFALIIPVSYVFASSFARRQTADRLEDVVSYIESNIDAADLRACRDSGVKSEKYVALQQFVNDLIDRFDVTYIYVVVPSEETLTNVVSATSAAEREAGEEDFPLLGTTDAYSKENLERYCSFYGTAGTHFFEETSEYGTYYTACKTIFDGKEPVALLCVDRDIKAVRKMISEMVGEIAASVFLTIVLFALLAGILIRKNILRPVLALEKSAREFSERSKDDAESIGARYEAPDIRVGNEIDSLAEAVDSMAESLRENAIKAVEATRRAVEAEQENAVWEEKVKAAEQIAKLSDSVTALLNNIPAMTFYKEIESGKYLMCNQAFAEYAGKMEPSEVIGLTDYDLFPKEAADHFVECDKIALSMDEPYVFFEDVHEGEDTRRQFRTVKLKFNDPDGVKRLLGMCIDMTETVKMQEENKIAKEAYEVAKHESVTYSRIARALSQDYIYLYYINVDSEDFIEYRSGSGRERLALERRGTKFFEASGRDAEKAIYREDRAMFIETFTKENVLKNIKAHGMFTLSYRLMIDGKPTYVNMKATNLNDDEDHIIIGVSNVNAQAKEQEAIRRMREEQITYERINALSGHYICIYTVDPETEKYTQYSATREYEGLGLNVSGEEFFARAREESASALYPEDLDLFRGAMTKENVLKEIKERGIFSINYRLMLGSTPTYVALRAALVEEKDGPQLIVGISNVDARVRREQAYAQDLSAARLRADSDALTGVKNKHAYIDAEGRINQSIEEKKEVAFAVVIFDVNGLKIINDTHGHVAGDEHIRKASKMICDVFKHSPVFRVGGDEFAVIAQGEDYERVDELVKIIEEKNEQNRASGEVTVACGMAKYARGEKDVASVFKRADAQMYKNKRAKKK